MRIATHALVLATITLGGCAVMASPEGGQSPRAYSLVDPVIIKRSSAEAPSLQTCPFGMRYIPVPPIQVSNYSVFTKIPNTDRWQTQSLAWPVNPVTGEINPEKINKLLPNISSNIADLRQNHTGDFGLLSLNTAERSYVFDFTKWRSEQIEPADQVGHTVGLVRVGAGLRVTVRLKSRGGWAGGSLLSLAASLKSERIEGSIETELIGVDAPDITMAFPFTTDLSESNIQRILESLGVLKAKLYSEKTSIVPHMLAKIECAPGVAGKGKY